MPKKSLSSHVPVKKTGQQNQKMKFEDKFIGVTQTVLTKPYIESINKKFATLSKILLRHSFIWSKLPPNENTIYRNYVQFYSEYFQLDQFDPNFQILPSLDANLYSVSNQQTIYKSFNVFHQCIWPVRFHTKFASKLAGYASNQIKFVFANIMLLAEGHFYSKTGLMKQPTIKGGDGYVSPVKSKSFPFNRFFTQKVFRQKNLLFSAGVEKFPIVKNGVIKRYEYRSYLYMLDILSDQVVENPNKLEEKISRFMQIILKDVAKKDHSEELQIDEKEKIKKKTIDFMFDQYQNPYTGLRQVYPTEFSPEGKHDYRPLQFKTVYVSSNDTSSLIFDISLKRWIEKDYLTNLQKKAFNEYQRKVNEELVKRFVDFQSAKTLVELLTKIPNFKVELTDQEKDVIGENGNVLVIGRSGTGKTTCAVLRLFAIQMLFKIRLSLSKKKHQEQLKDTRCSADDIDKTMGLHCVFLTASPVLTNQIERYYKKLTDNIKLELEKKKKRIEEERKKKEEEDKKSMMKKKTEVLDQSVEHFEEIKPIEIVQVQDQSQEIVEQESDEEAPEQLVIKKSQQALQQEQQMNNQLGGIKLDEKIQNQKFEEDQENFEEMRDQLQNKMKKFKSLHDLQESDYPGFFTVKSFIMMIDGSLQKPFFIRKSQSNTQQSQATWHNQKKGVMMIENYYRNDDEEKKQIAEEQIEEEVNYSDQQQLQHEYLRQIQLKENKQKQKLTQKLKKNKKALSFQVDYDYFLIYFWPNVRHRHYSARNITPHLVWTEIYSTIKGGANSHLYPGFYLTQKAYITESSNSFLTKQQKLDVYQLFCQYERWKISNGGYDMMDAVNYILNFIRFRGFSGPEIHYIMIDEVQDLPHSIVYLLSKTVRYGVFYSGDTAQTIAKGVGFRFCDLKNLFDPKQFDFSLQLKKPIVKQLTVNFRSHNNILQLANSVVSSIQILFPKTIDRLKKQVSNLSGPKPMILAEGNQQLLFYVLCGQEGYKKNNSQEDNMKKPPLQFGCDQVIIVRDQESKNRIPGVLQHALCLTIYQAKGLQFNDVILFNFFTESKCADKWNLLKFLKVVISEMDIYEYKKSVTKHNKKKKMEESSQQNLKVGEGEKKIEEPEQIDVECSVNLHQNIVYIKKIVSDAKILMKDINDYAELCSELKMLYTAITRPKNTLIIYDEDSTARKTIEKLWQRLQVVELVSKELLEESNKKKNETEELKIFKTIISSTNKQEWKKQGMKMYSRGFFQQAMKCFQNSGHQQWFKKSQANNIADCATKSLIEIQAERDAIANKLAIYQRLSESDIAKLKKGLKKKQSQTFLKFEEAGKVFEELLMFKQAGQCFFSGRKYQTAFQNFSKAFMNRQAGQSLQMLNKYREAAEFYEKEGLYLKVIECLDLVNEWQAILLKIQKFANLMSDIEKKSLFKKYSALALQQLVYQIQFQNEPDQSKPENNRVQIIKQEEQSEQQDWDSNEDPEVAAQRALSKKSQSSYIASRKLSNMSGADIEEKVLRKGSVVDQPRKQLRMDQQQIIKESVYENFEGDENQKQFTKAQQQLPEQSSSFADLNESNQNSQIENNISEKGVLESYYEKKVQNKEQVLISIYEDKKDLSKKQQAVIQSVHEARQIVQADRSDSSFADLNQSSSSFADLNSQHSSEFNARYPAELEPDIQSIKSLADPEDPWIQSALSQINAKTHTEYSIIDEEENYNPNIKIIKTKGNIMVQDQIMKKIFGIVSIVNQSVQQFFRQFKGYQSLITIAKNTENQDTIDNRPQISEFQQIDPKFINIILDTLESFKLYKLCLFVCNRYHLPHKAGRYLVSMALKYSTNAQVNNTLNPSLIAPSLHRKAELEKGILASIALHSMFENVSPDFLKIRITHSSKQEAKNTLGSYFIQGLILEGLYKKAVFMVNPEESLNIVRNFCDSEIYKQIFKQKFLKGSQRPSLGHVPKNKLEQDYTIVRAQEALHHHNIVSKIDVMSQRYHKQFNVLDLKAKLQSAQLQQSTPLLHAFLAKDKSKTIQILNREAPHCQKILQSGPSYKIYDLVAFLTTTIKYEEWQDHLFNLKHSQFLEYFACIRTIRKALRKKHLSTSYQIIQSVFSVFFCRMIDPSKSSKFMMDGYSLLHRASSICNQFVEELKKNKNEIAFFFQQDYNYIVVKTTKLTQVICKKFDQNYSKFLRNRVQAKLDWVNNLYQSYLHQNFKQEQSEFLLKALLREQLRLLSPRQRKKLKEAEKKQAKKQKPKFNYKMQGRPELVVDLQSESEAESIQNKQNKLQITNFFILPDLNPNFIYLSDLALSAFTQKTENTEGKMVSGRLLYSSGLNDSYKQFLHKKEDKNLYDAIQFRKFNRLDLYADNILSIINDLSYSQRHIISAQILLHLLVQYKIFEQGKNFKLDIPRRFLRFFPNLKLKELINVEGSPTHSLVNEYINTQGVVCSFTYNNLYSSEYSEKSQIGGVICQFLELLKIQQSYKCYSIEKLILIFVINMPENSEVYECLLEFMKIVGAHWTNPILLKLRLASNLKQFIATREKILRDEKIKNSQVLHQIKVTDKSKGGKDIEDSERDYEIKEKILNARVKAVQKIVTWWRIVKKKSKHSDQMQIVKENRVVKITHSVKYLPLDDRFILRSSNVRDFLISFFLRVVVTSSLDFHFILMTLNNIQDLRSKYIKAYSQGLVEVEDREIDFGEEIANIQSIVQIWKNDAKWLKDRNMDLKRKKVFEVKWMTKNTIQKIIKRRAGLQKQKKLQDKKKILKRNQ